MIEEYTLIQMNSCIKKNRFSSSNGNAGPKIEQFKPLHPILMWQVQEFYIFQVQFIVSFKKISPITALINYINFLLCQSSDSLPMFKSHWLSSYHWALGFKICCCPHAISSQSAIFLKKNSVGASLTNKQANR